MPNTKIVATLGPASQSPETVRQLLEAGVDVFRLNASHGNNEFRAQIIKHVREISADLGIHTGILLDLQGPKIRLGIFEESQCRLKTGDPFTITTQEVTGNNVLASTTYSDFANDVKVGDRILLNDGAVELRAMSNDGTAVKCEVISGGPIGDRKGINLPGVNVSAPSLTKKDLTDLHFGIDQQVDFIALSFVRTANDILRLKFVLEEREAKIPIVAKIEKPQAVQNLDAILKETHGVMVARGDLGIEVALEKVPFIQKNIIRKTRVMNKFVITATQMLESMMENAHPTRAEVSDVANAIYDGTDAVMLSGETAAGRYPVNAAAIMRRIAAEVEVSLKQRGFRDLAMNEDPTTSEIIAESAFRAAKISGAKAIVVFSSSGYIARCVARYRPPVPIYAFTPSERSARQMALIFGVTALVAEDVFSTDAMINQLEEVLKENNFVETGDRVVFTSGQPIGVSGSTNMLMLHVIT